MTAYILKIYKEIRVEFSNQDSNRGMRNFTQRTLDSYGWKVLTHLELIVFPPDRPILSQGLKNLLSFGCRKVTLSTRVEEDKDVVFLLALVLYFLPTLGDITKVKEQKEKPKQKKNQG